MKFIGLILALFVTHISMHDIHVSLTELHIDVEDGVAQLSVHIFLDDLEAVLLQRDVKLDLYSDREHSEADSHILSYLKDHISLYTNRDSADWQFVGRELSNDMQAAYFFLEATISNSDAYSFSQTVLFDLFDDQQSICDINIGTSKKNVLLYSGYSNVKLLTE